jgi:hypothetical protein
MLLKFLCWCWCCVTLATTVILTSVESLWEVVAHYKKKSSLFSCWCCQLCWITSIYSPFDSSLPVAGLCHQLTNALVERKQVSLHGLMENLCVDTEPIYLYIMYSFSIHTCILHIWILNTFCHLLYLLIYIIQPNKFVWHSSICFKVVVGKEEYLCFFKIVRLQTYSSDGCMTFYRLWNLEIVTRLCWNPPASL